MAGGGGGGGNKGKVIAQAAPLGLFSFALTTFVISSYNAGILGVSATDPINAIVTLGLFYGGGAQALAGMWAFVHGDVFAATAFTSYGAFWISYSAIYVPAFGVSEAYSGGSESPVLANAKATYLLGWTIFTFIMFVGSLRTSTALAALFALVAATFTLLTAAEFARSTAVHRAGGFVGLVTAAAAWYNALAELLDSQPDAILSLPLGRHVIAANPSGSCANSRNTKAFRGPTTRSQSTTPHGFDRRHLDDHLDDHDHDDDCDYGRRDVNVVGSTAASNKTNSRHNDVDNNGSHHVVSIMPPPAGISPNSAQACKS